MYKQVKGTLTVLQATAVDGCKEFYDFDGRDITFPSKEQAAATPKGGVISLAINSKNEVSPEKPWFIPVQASDQPATWEGRRPVNIGIFKVQSREDYDEAAELKHVTAAAQEVQNFWRRQAGRKWDIKVVGYVLPLVEGDEPPDRGKWCVKSIAALQAANPEDEFLQNIDKFHLWGNRSSSYCGWGQRPGKYGMTFIDCGPRTMCHELGHNFGLPHSNSKDLETGESAEYGDTSCVMGRSHRSVNAPHRAKLGLDTSEEIMLLNKSRRFLLSELLTEPEDLHPNMFNHVQLANGGRTYSLSCTSLAYVEVHELPNRYNDRKPHRVHQIKAGTSFVLEDIFTITFEAVEHGYALVSVDMGDGHPLQDVEIPQSLPAAYPASRPVEAHQGIWWVPELSGQGFDIQIDPEASQGVLTWYTYNTKKAKLQNFYSQRWFTGEFNLNATDFPLQSYNSQKVLETVGKAQLNFIDEDNGLLRYHLYGKNGSVPITRLTWGQSARQGLYYSNEGQQLSVHYFGSKLVAFVTGFCDVPLDYMGRPVKGAITNQEWMLLIGEAKPVTTQVTVTGGNDGKFMEMIAPDLEQKGTGQLVYNSAGTWTFKYDGFEYHFE